MQLVRHDFLRERAIGGEELGADIEVVDLLAVVELSDEFIHGLILGATRVAGFTSPAREDSEEEDLGVRRALMDSRDDILDTGGDLFDRVLADAAVIGADHEDDDLRLDAFEFTVLDAPEHMLGAVATDAEVSGLILGILFFEEGLLAVPASGDGVTEKHDLGLTLLGDFHEGIVGLLEASLDLTISSDLRGGDISWLRWSLRGGGLDGDLGRIGGRLLRLVGAKERNLSQ